MVQARLSIRRDHSRIFELMKSLRLLVLGALAPLLFAQTYGLMPVPKLQFLDANGYPLAGGLVYTCVAGSSCPGTPQATYTDSTGGTANQNPVVLDAGGFGAIWLGTNTYKIVVETSAGAIISTTDQVSNAGLGAVASLSGSNGASLVNYTAPPTGAVTRTVAAKLYDVVNAADFGAACDSITDNATAFGKLATFVNSTSTVFRIQMPPGGVCNYSSGLTLTQPFVLDLGGSTLNYTGGAHAMDIGPTNLNATTAFSYLTYVVQNGTFIGGASMTEGLYFNAFITQPRVLNVNFVNFGNLTAYGLFFQANNWDILVDGCRFTGTPSSNGANWIRVNGASDNGQSRLRFTHGLGTQQASAGGVGIYLGGYNSEVSSSKIEGFTPNIVVGASAVDAVISNTYMEATQSSAKACITYGDQTGANIGNYTQYLQIRNSYCNVHNTDFSTTNAFLAPSTSSGGLQYTQFEQNTVSTKTVGSPMVVQNNNGSQMGNLATSAWDGTVGGRVDVLHTAGGSIANWAGAGGDEFDLTNPLDASEFVIFKAGKTANQYEGFYFQGYNSSTLGSFTMGADSKARLTVGSYTALFNTDGSLTLAGGLTAGSGSFASASVGTSPLYVTGVAGQTAPLVSGSITGTGTVFGITPAGAYQSQGSTGVSATVSCTSGQHLNGLTIVGGLVTAAPGCN